MYTLSNMISELTTKLLNIVDKLNLSPVKAFQIAMTIELALAVPVLYDRYFRRKLQERKPESIFIEEASKFPKDINRQLAIDKVKPPHIWDGASIFFPDAAPELENSPTNQLIWFFKQAKFRIQLCIYLSSYPPIEAVIMDMVKEGILVQVITDYDTTISHNNFNVNRWKSRGIEVKLNPHGHLMHNKFAIIDEQAVVTGSLNWTKQGIGINSENVVVSTDYRIVDKYMVEYEKIWATCDETSNK